MSVRLLIVDDHALFRQGLTALLREQSGWEVVGEADSGEDAFTKCQSLRPDVVIMDVEMPGQDGIRTAKQINDAFPSTKIVALSMYTSSYYQVQMFEAGAVGYVSKSQPIEELVGAIRSVLTAGNAPAVSGPAQSIEGKTSSAQIDVHTLSNREREVLLQLAKGLKTSAIAHELDISQKTVETYRARLQQKLKIHDLPGLVRFAIRAGLIPSER